MNVCATDDDAVGCETVAVGVFNADPTFESFGIFDQAGAPKFSFMLGETVIFSGTIEDAGAADTHIVTIEWGDGAVDTADYTIWADNFGAGMEPGGEASSGRGESSGGTPACGLGFELLLTVPIPLGLRRRRLRRRSRSDGEQVAREQHR